MLCFTENKAHIKKVPLQMADNHMTTALRFILPTYSCMLGLRMILYKQTKIDGVNHEKLYSGLCEEQF